MLERREFMHASKRGLVKKHRERDIAERSGETREIPIRTLYAQTPEANRRKKKECGEYHDGGERGPNRNRRIDNLGDCVHRHRSGAEHEPASQRASL